MLPVGCVYMCVCMCGCACALLCMRACMSACARTCERAFTCMCLPSVNGVFFTKACVVHSMHAWR